MTRAEIEAKYTIVDGVIQNIGRFEGEAIYIPYYFSLAKKGDIDEYDPDEESYIFEISPEDELQFPELNPYTHVKLIVTEDDMVIGLAETKEDE